MSSQFPSLEESVKRGELGIDYYASSDSFELLFIKHINQRRVQVHLVVTGMYVVPMRLPYYVVSGNPSIQNAEETLEIFALCDAGNMQMQTIRKTDKEAYLPVIKKFVSFNFLGDAFPLDVSRKHCFNVLKCHRSKMMELAGFSYLQICFLKGNVQIENMPGDRRKYCIFSKDGEDEKLAKHCVIRHDIKNPRPQTIAVSILLTINPGDARQATIYRLDNDLPIPICTEAGDASAEAITIARILSAETNAVLHQSSDTPPIDDETRSAQVAAVLRANSSHIKWMAEQPQPTGYTMH